ncbi:hypothetical protein HOK51_00085 [Candidatus Woesearchaeota archaeon]|jgi:hypothetical protein|nr:hypothetical protein [archaeon]MBT6518210.1 hypothetical protein [Candidatus Woesearchaeota archaeon]MBT7368521.1 hypothetical protein [Candidatus Woesearchaeota archaeon]
MSEKARKLNLVDIVSLAQATPLSEKDLKTGRYESLKLFQLKLGFIEGIRKYKKIPGAKEKKLHLDSSSFTNQQIAKGKLPSDPSWIDFAYYFAVNLDLPVDLLKDVVQRVSDCVKDDGCSDPECPSIFEFVKMELAQEEKYALKFEEECEKIRQKYADKQSKLEKEMGTTFDNPRFVLLVESSKLYASYSDKCRDQIGIAMNRYKGFITSEELQKLDYELSEWHLFSKVELKASIGYDPRENSEKRLASLQELYETNGRTKKQMLRDMAFKKIDDSVIETLSSIAEHDPFKAASEYASNLISSYKLMDEFNPTKRLMRGGK